MEDVLIVGAGIVGLMCALELQQRGARVRVLDAGARKPSASWAGGGILSPLFPWRYPDSLLALTHDARERYEYWCETIGELSGDRPELHTCGMWVREHSPDNALHWAARHQVSLLERPLASCFPGWDWSESGLWMPAVGAIRNPQVLTGLRALALHRGVRFESTEVVQVRADNASVLTVDGDWLQADRLLLAAGQWSAALTAQWLEQGLLFPVRGQMLLYQLEPGALPGILLSEQGYLIPRRDGLVLVGSTLEQGEDDCVPTQQAATQLAALAAELMPALAGKTALAQWAGIRPGCRRAYPVIRPLQGDRTWLVAGHYRNGLVAAPATAQLVAELVSGDVPFVDPSAYQ